VYAVEAAGAEPLRAQAKMPWLVPIPRALARTTSLIVLVLWPVQMAWLVRHSYGSHSAPLTADLARYAQDAQWRGVYYRGDKLGFLVGQTRAVESGYEIQEDGQLEMTLLGSSSAVRLHTLVQVDKAFELERFSFALDPGTGPMTIAGRLDGARLELSIESRAGKRVETRELSERPVLSLNLPRRLAALGLHAGQHLSLSNFDPTTLRNAPVTIDVEAREVIWSMHKPVPVFRIRTTFQGLSSNSWITDLGDVVKEESPMGMLVVRETREQAMSMGVPGDLRRDLLQSAAVQATGERIVDPVEFDRVRLRLVLPQPFDGDDLQGAGQTRSGDIFEIVSGRVRTAEPLKEDLTRYLRPEPFIESDAPEIQAEAKRATQGLDDPRARAERLVRHVNQLIEKKPTVSLPSALEVLRTRVGDCNEHTALYVALARAAGIPARVAVGLVSMRGAFYYHAWAEVYLSAGARRGMWIPMDPTLDQVPADPTHLRLARGGFESQARILPLVGRTRIEVLEIQRRPGVEPVLVGATRTQHAPLPTMELPSRTGGRRGCWSDPKE
jgi:Transglutaminase-like superfamily